MLLVPGFMTMLLADLLSVARCHGAAPSSYMLNLALRAMVSSGLCSFHASVGPAGVVWWGMCLDIYIYIICVPQSNDLTKCHSFFGQVKETEVFSERMTWEETADLHSRSDNLRWTQRQVVFFPAAIEWGSERIMNCPDAPHPFSTTAEITTLAYTTPIWCRIADATVAMFNSPKLVRVLNNAVIKIVKAITQK